MVIPQVINLDRDAAIAINGDDIIDDTDQLPLGTDHGKTTVNIDMKFWNLMTNTLSSVTDIAMTYRADVDCWTIDTVDLTPASLADRSKYFVLVSEHSGGTADMRDFKILECSVENDSAEDVLMRLPYQVEIGATSYMVWYEDGHLGVGGFQKFKAPVYQGGTGTTYASDPSKVTHRGAIVPF